jgi:hypothetical protein
MDLFHFPKLPETQPGYTLNKFATDAPQIRYTTGEYLAYNSPYVDPLTLNFRVLADWDKPSGLLAEEKYPNSALAYLKRIGEEYRYYILQTWQQNFQKLLQNMEFLFLTVDGLDTIATHTMHNAYTDGQINFGMRETSDMRIQSLITTYRQIYFDEERMVEVLPLNLRRFNFYVFVYASGYYNMALYDLYNTNGDRDIFKSAENDEYFIYPTLRKLYELPYFKTKRPEFNNAMFSIRSATLNVENSGKSIFSTVSNEQSSEQRKNELVFDYKFAEQTGTFNNIFGQFNFGIALAELTAFEKASNNVKTDDVPENLSQDDKDLVTRSSDENVDTKSNISGLQKLKAKAKASGNTIASGLKKGAEDSISTLKNAATMENAKRIGEEILHAKSSPISSALNAFNSEDYWKQMITNTVSKYGTEKVNAFANTALTKLNNLITGNFSDNLVDNFKNYKAIADKLFNKTKTIQYDDKNKLSPSEFTAEYLAEKETLTKNSSYEESQKRIVPGNPNITYQEHIPSGEFSTNNDAKLIDEDTFKIKAKKADLQYHEDMGKLENAKENPVFDRDDKLLGDVTTRASNGSFEEDMGKIAVGKKNIVVQNDKYTETYEVKESTDVNLMGERIATVGITKNIKTENHVRNIFNRQGF